MSQETFGASTKAARGFAERLKTRRPLRRSIDQYTYDLQKEGRITPAVQESLDKARAVRLGHEAVFYIAGALTGVGETTKARSGQVSDLIANYSQPQQSDMFGYAPHLHGTDPIKHPDTTPQEVRDIDYLWAGVVADCHLNFLEPVAHGNAIEAGWAEELRVPSVHLTPEGMTTSRLVRGMNNILGTLVYTDFETDGLPQVERFLREVHSELGELSSHNLPRARYANLMTGEII